MFLGKGVLKICSKFTGEHPCRSVISISFKFCQVSSKTKGFLTISGGTEMAESK